MWWSKTSGQFISKEKENIYEILELSASHIVRRWSSSIFNCRFNIFLIKLLWINSAILEEKVNYFLFLWIFYTELSICSFEIPKFFSICEYIQEVLYKLRKLFLKHIINGKLRIRWFFRYCIYLYIFINIVLFLWYQLFLLNKYGNLRLKWKNVTRLKQFFKSGVESANME